MKIFLIVSWRIDWEKVYTIIHATSAEAATTTARQLGITDIITCYELEN